VKRWELIAQRVNDETTPRTLTKGEVAKRLGFSRPALDRRLKGQTDWEYDRLEVLAGLFGITVDQLISDESGENGTSVGGSS
jgi:transcriptional regulator with XRE-family HTH domain